MGTRLTKKIDNFQHGQTKTRTLLPVGGTHIHDTSLELLPSGLVKLEFHDNETSIEENSFHNTTMILDLKKGWELQSRSSFLAHPSEAVKKPSYRRNKSLVNSNKIETSVALDQKRYTPLIPAYKEDPLTPDLLNLYLQPKYHLVNTKIHGYDAQGKRILPSSGILNVTV